MKVDLERLRRSLARYVHAEENAVPVATGELEALLDVYKRYGAKCDGVTDDTAAIKAAHGDRAWDDVDRWNAERDLAVKAAVDAARARTLEFPAKLDRSYVFPDDAAAFERDRARDQLADAGVAVQRQFRSDQERIAELERQLEAERTRGIDHAVYEMVCAERDGLEASLARVPALVETVRKAKDRIGLTVYEGTPVSVWAGKDIIAKIDAALAEWEKP